MEEAFWQPPLHQFKANYTKDLRIRKEADKGYICKGLHVYVHHVEGCEPEGHVRVGYLIQFGRFVIKSADGTFCFFATKGINPFNVAGLKKIKKGDKKPLPANQIPFDEGV